MSNSESFDIQSDSGLESAVRTETGYDTGKLSDSDLTSLIESAKRVLALKANVTNFYTERGLAVALLGVTCAKAKGVMENSPVQVKNLAGQDVTFRTTDGSSLQIAQYEDMVQMGLSEASSTDAGVQGLELSGTYYSDNSSL